MRRTPHLDAPQLCDLIGDPDRFISDTIFRAPLVTRGMNLTRFPSGEQLWGDLLRGGTRQPGFRLVRAGDTTGRGGVTRSVGIGNRTLADAIDANAVIDHYRRGDTVVLQGLHHTDPVCARLVTNLSLALDQPTQVNAYLSPPAEQGLDIHFDYHDVFVVQLAGSKRWRVWDRLPRTIDPLRNVVKIDKPDPAELGDPLLELVLEPGDMLYLPRGYPHAATTTDEASDHLTIGMTALTWHRFYRHVLDIAANRGEFRAALPAGSLSASVEPGPPPDPSVLTKMLSVRDYREWLARTIWSRMPQTRLRPRSPIDTDAPLEFTPGPLAWVTERDGRTLLGIGDRVLTLPVEATELLLEIFDTDGPIDAGTLTTLDADSRSAVLRRLVAEGLLGPASS